MPIGIGVDIASVEIAIECSRHPSKITRSGSGRIGAGATDYCSAVVQALALVARRVGLSSGSADAMRPSGWLLPAAIISRLSALVALLLISRMLAPSELGRLTLIQSAALIATAVAGLGLPLAVVRQVAHVRDDSSEAAGRYLGSAVLATLLASAITVAALSAERDWVAATALGDDSLANLVPAAAAGVAGLAIATVAQAGLSGLETFRRVAVLQCVQGALASTGLVIGATTDGVQGALVGFAIGQFVAAGLSLAVLRRYVRGVSVPLSTRLERPEARSMMVFAAPAIFASLAVSLALLGGQMLLRNEPDGYAYIAEFSVAYRWHLAIVFVPLALVPAAIPILTRLHTRDRRGARETLRFTVIAGFAMAAVPAAVVAIAAPLILGLSGDYYEARPWTLVVLAIAAVPLVLNNILSSAAISYGSVRAWLVSDVVLAAAVIALALALVPSMQAVGLALAYFGGYVLTDLALIPSVARQSRDTSGDQQ